MVTKIVCAYHEGAAKTFHEPILKRPDLFVPVLGGAFYYKPGKDRFYDELQRDDDGENISPLTIFINEHSPIYWAYKNYDKLGNPDLIGLAHYRRFMNLDYDHLDPDLVYGNRVSAAHAGGIRGTVPDTVRNTYINFCGEELVEFYCDAFRFYLPDYIQDLDMVLDDMYYYAKNMFIMKKSTFFEFMSFVVRVLRILFDDKIYHQAVSIFYPQTHIRRLMLTHSRARGFLMEMFTAVWFEHQQRIHGNVVSVPLLEFK